MDELVEALYKMMLDPSSPSANSLFWMTHSSGAENERNTCHAFTAVN